MMIRKAGSADAWAIAEIYNYYVINTVLTSELECVTPYMIVQRIEQWGPIGACLVCEENQVLVGYTCVSELREGQASDHVVESTIYLRKGFEGQGIGFNLYSELLSKTIGQYQLIISGIALSNTASIRLHEKCGFQKVPYFSRAAKKFGEWIEINFWQINLSTAWKSSGEERETITAIAGQASQAYGTAD
jgi:L-amino acid N-acyltransferase YncA